MKLLLTLFGLAALFAACECAFPINAVPITSNFTYAGLQGPESIDVDSDGVFYVSVGDGSIRRINADGTNTVYAYTNPSITNRTAAGCGTPLPANEVNCGRPLGIKFDAANNLYVADAYKGLLVIPRNNVTNVTILATQSTDTNIPFNFTNALLLTDNYIYFTDTSPSDYRVTFVKVLLENKPIGRLLRYDRASGSVTTLISDLVFANGIAFNSNRSIIVVNETGKKRMRRYYVTGEKAGTNDVFNADLGCYPDNVEFDSVTGYFLVGCYGDASSFIDTQVIGNATAVAYWSANPVALLSNIAPRGVIPCLTENGVVARTLYDSTGVNVWRTAEAKRVGDYIYVGSVLNTYLNRIPASLLTDAIPTTTPAPFTTTNAASAFQPLFALVAASLLAMLAL